MGRLRPRPRYHVISFRVTGEELKLFQQYAKTVGAKSSELARGLVAEGLRKRAVEIEEC